MFHQNRPTESKDINFQSLVRNLIAQYILLFVREEKSANLRSRGRVTINNKTNSLHISINILTIISSILQRVDKKIKHR